ncbi:hypothetical protein [Rhabdothermincola salaria]|uniref:hypothetical protein n=1 Tax=Rhabdothermincola salaria TaxID=2903142 RepID=UPI001E2CF80B|nr:hypothetical protein [Rhabdothermincola salaria]MCD9624835.1 hypothetical protein [Rhabdothermincola salaria]
MESTTSSTTPASGGSPRVEQFKNDVSDMNLKAGNAGREKMLGAIGLVLMIVGVIGAFFAYVSTTNQTLIEDQQESIVMALTFVTVSVLGLGLFVRYAFANFLRMWLLRQLYEGQANTDRLIEAIEDRG